MKTLKNQNGMTMWGWLVILTMVGYIGIQGFSLISPVINYTTVKSVLDNAAEDQKLKGLPAKTVASLILKRVNFNGVKDFDIKDKEAFQIKKTKKGLEIIVKYKQKASFFGPLDLLLTLDHEILIGG